MRIRKVVVRNYRCLRQATVELNPELNIIVGNNECGKSTLLEAIHLALSGQLNGRPIAGEMHPHLFNQECVAEYIAGLAKGVPPPAILIELYLENVPALAALKGTNNTLAEDCPGIKMEIGFNPDFKSAYADYIANPELVQTVPIEYYRYYWRHFGDSDITARNIALKPTLIDASTIRNNLSANRYVVDILRDSLNSKQQVELALSYRLMKNTFLDDERIAAINKELEKKRGKISEKSLSVSLDTTARASWESGIMPHLDAIPLPLVGKGEQNSVKIKLALESSSECHLVMIEEAENHLSHSRLNELISHISANRGDRQLIITTHSSFVLNKLGIESVILFARGASATLNALDPDTYGYFMKLAGYDTLRLILAKRAILVEGPSDELLVIRAYERKHGKSPLADGVDVITVNSLAFKRFLEIARLLNREVDVVTDNDGKIAKVAETYQEFADVPTIKVQFDEDEAFPTLEPQLLKINGRDKLNEILGTKYPTDDDLLKFMKNNKTKCALRLFESKTEWAIPDYIARAVR